MGWPDILLHGYSGDISIIIQNRIIKLNDPVLQADLLNRKKN
jgi:hypothetical protein